MSQDVHYLLRLRPLPGSDVPPVKRLAHLLKLAKRVCGLQCVRYRQVDAKAKLYVRK